MTARLVADLILRGAEVIDGTGAPGVFADVAIAGDRIVALAPAGRLDPELSTAETRRLDLDGRTLAPGFIDTHTHDDFAVVFHPEMGFKVEGGVTTCIVGNCGMGAAPHAAASAVAQSFHPDSELPPWDGFAGYLAHLEAHPASVNVAALMGHGTLRAAVMRGAERAPDDGERRRLHELLREGMEAGCLGLSTGLIYPPGKFADTDELVDLARVVAGFGGLYTSHVRDEGEGLLDSIAEAIEIGQRAGAAVVISHLKANGRNNWGRVGSALDLIARAQAAGQPVAADQYPYTAGSTVLSALVGQHAFDSSGRRVATLRGHDVVIAACPNRPDWNGRSLADLGDELGLDTAATADHVVAVDLRTNVVIHSMSEDDVRTILGTPGIMIGSDGLPTLDGQPHPRLYGTFARVLGHYSRDLGLLSLPEAVHRMTGRPAAVFGLHDRGVIRPGAIADLVAFDAATIIDRGTFDDPHHSPAGIDHVWVSGIAVVADGRHTGARPGRVVRRSTTSVGS